MKNNKSLLQKSSLYFSIASFLASVACVIYLTLKIDNLGWENPVSASLLAATFFFAFVGVVLAIIGTSNIPSFKFDSAENVDNNSD
ncbi:MAG: hypothetical protein V3W04_09445 [Gammaproteobacteria bacterium]